MLTKEALSTVSHASGRALREALRYFHSDAEESLVTLSQADEEHFW